MNLDTRELRRCAYEAKAVVRLDRQMDACEELIGELIREGRTVHYVNLRNGKTREGHRAELVNFLIRNRYV